MTVYFLQYGDEPLVKIGHSKNAYQRIATLQCGQPKAVKTLANVPGGRDAERAFHAKFKHLQARKEWFKLEGDLVEFLANPGPIEPMAAPKQFPRAGNHLEAAWRSRLYKTDDEMCWIFGMDADILREAYGPSGRAGE